jgi:hypothetical protein
MFLFKVSVEASEDIFCYAYVNAMPHPVVLDINLALLVPPFFYIA